MVSSPILHSAIYNPKSAIERVQSRIKRSGFRFAMVAVFCTSSFVLDASPFLGQRLVAALPRQEICEIRGQLQEPCHPEFSNPGIRKARPYGFGGFFTDKWPWPTNDLCSPLLLSLGGRIRPRFWFPERFSSRRPAMMTGRIVFG